MGYLPITKKSMKEVGIKKKNIFVERYALSRGFVAIGYGWIRNIKEISVQEIHQQLKIKGCGKIGKRTKEILCFANEIEKGDVILLYNHFKVYVGIVKDRDNKPYYYVERNSKDDFIDETEGDNIAPHRIDVEWQFNNKSFSADFSSWQDTVHRVLQSNILEKDMNEKLREYLLQKISENPPTPPTPPPRRPPERGYEGLPPEYYEKREKEMKKEKEIEEEFNQITDYVIRQIIAIVKKKLMESQDYSSMVGIAQRNGLEEDDIWPDVDYDYDPFGISGCGLIFHNDGSELMRVLTEDYLYSSQSIPFGEELERWHNYVVNEIKKLCQICFNRIIFVE